MALRAHGYQAPSHELDKAYDSFTAQGGGELNYRTFQRKLRPRSASAAVATEPTLKHPLRHTMQGRLGAALPMRVQLDFDSTSDSVVAQLREVLTEHNVRVIDLFRDWDEDGDGIISRKEFRQAMPALGLDMPNYDCADQLFDSFDQSKSGVIEMKELNRLLKRRL